MVVLLTRQPKNTLNDLDAKEWVKSTKSWFVVNPRSRSKEQIRHPAKFPEELVIHFLNFFTKQDGWILDPFVGVGSTLIACRQCSRNAVGIELHSEFVEVGRKGLESVEGGGNQYFILGDARSTKELLAQHLPKPVPLFDYLITSPPYWDMLRKSRGGNESVHKQREKKGLKQYYSDLDRDLGNISEYEEYIEAVGSIIGGLKPLLRDRAYLSLIVQNMRNTDGDVKPIAWDLGKRLSKDYKLCQEMIWCQDNKQLGCWGYPTTYISNVHHHYCLIFQNCLDR